MEKIASFTIDHIKLQPGVYVSRLDQIGAENVTTFDLRMTSPNEEPVMNTAEMHTIEHLAATFLRNHPQWKERTIYFGPMGCRTGFYLLLPGYCAADGGDVHIYPGFRGRSARCLGKGLRQLSGYEPAHGEVRGKELSGNCADWNWRRPPGLSGIRRKP